MTWKFKILKHEYLFDSSSHHWRNICKIDSQFEWDVSYESLLDRTGFNLTQFLLHGQKRGGRISVRGRLRIRRYVIFCFSLHRFTISNYDTGGRGQPNPFMVPVNNCPDDLFDNTSPDLRVPQLPWNLQDDWGCEREPQDVPVIELESETLKASVTTQWGGKV